VPASDRDQPNTAAAIAYVKQAWGLDAFGWRATGSVPGSDHPKGLALDIPVRSVGLGEQIARWFLDHAQAFGTSYVIWNRRIANPGQPWRPYSGPSPHTDHVHVSLGTGAFSGATAAGISSSSGGDLVGAVVQPTVTGLRRIVVTVAFVGLGLGLVALGGFRAVRKG